ncbi:MAG TPA: Clp protease N-terminal domain-containing protein [Roseiflexaceae bacterium]|nr:Clp protease N-terminal domain-containing protein [Roseiflexaceae bacterium]
MWLDHCDAEVRAAVQQGQQIATHARHTQIDVEHIFLALLRKPEGLTREVLRWMGVSADDVAVLIGREVDRQPRLSVYNDRSQVYISPRTRRLIQTAEFEAAQAGVELAGVEHILLALMDDPDSPTAQVLKRVDVTPDRMRVTLGALRQPTVPGSEAVTIEGEAVGHTPPRIAEQPPAAGQPSAAEPQAAPAAPAEAEAAQGLRAELDQARRRIAELEQEQRHLTELLRRADETLAYTRTLLDQEIALRHWAERQRSPRAPSPASEEQPSPSEGQQP